MAILLYFNRCDSLLLKNQSQKINIQDGNYRVLFIFSEMQL
jgi:hypothetical protein